MSSQNYDAASNGVGTGGQRDKDCGQGSVDLCKIWLRLVDKVWETCEQGTVDFWTS